MKDSLDRLKFEWLNKSNKNRLGSCLESLTKYIDSTSNKQEELNAIIHRFNSNEDYSQSGKITHEDYAIEERKIAAQLRQFISEIQLEDLSSHQLMQNKIHEKIIVITYDDDSKEKMKTFFDKFYFANVCYNTSGKVLTHDELKKYDIILFDYMYNTSAKHYDLLESYLKTTDMPILYFGTETLIVLKEQEYAQRVHSANFVISLYTRLKEMIEFQKYYKKSSNS